MGICPLASKIAALNELLGIVPGAAGISHHHSQEETSHQSASQHPSKGLLANSKPDNQRASYRQQAGNHHLSEGRRRADLYAPGVVWLGLTLH